MLRAPLATTSLIIGYTIRVGTLSESDSASLSSGLAHLQQPTYLALFSLASIEHRHSKRRTAWQAFVDSGLVY